MIDAGWAEQHPAARRGEIPPSAVMLYAPRDDHERAVVAALVTAAHQFATDTWPGSDAWDPGPTVHPVPTTGPEQPEPGHAHR